MENIRFSPMSLEGNEPPSNTEYEQRSTLGGLDITKVES